MLRVISRVLGARHEVLTSHSAPEALALAGRVRPDLAIVDVRMPELNGFELTARLKQAVPGIDVILMTGSVSTLDDKLVRALREQAFYFLQKPFDREVLETLVDRCLELRRLADLERRHVRRLEGELAQARAFQASLFPPPRWCLGPLSLDCLWQPCSELGGDLYDYADAGQGRAAFLVADVSGHGAAAAMLTGIVKAAFQAARHEDFAPAAVAARIDAGLATLGPQRFVTAFAGRLGRGGRRLEYLSAGHPKALLARPDGGRAELASTGLLLSSAFAAADRRQETVALGPGDRLLVYTDGVVEAGADDDPFGDERLGALLAASGQGEDGGAFLARVAAAVRDHRKGRPPADDQTLVLATMS
jgi:sigma-B regulation protein RsbU (phosphoserine phosphatase)